MNVLDSYFSAEEIKGLEEQAESFLRQDETFDSVSKMICTDDAYETQNQIKMCIRDRRKRSTSLLPSERTVRGEEQSCRSDRLGEKITRLKDGFGEG